MSEHLNTFQDDPCCNDALIVALGKTELIESFAWNCPKCGCTWKAEIIGEVKHWSPVPMIEILRV